MKICFLGLDNLPVLAPEHRAGTFGGEPVQQTLLARALARRGHDVSMVVLDQGQVDGRAWEGIRTFAAYAPAAGVPVLRFAHPRWTGLWKALRRADAEVYYTSCAGMHVGLLAAFCRRHGRRFVFRTASDSDCDPKRLLVRFARDRWLYRLGVQRADAVLVQSAWQARALEENYGVRGRYARMLVEPAPTTRPRDIDVLWVSNIRRVKRPDRILGIARSMPGVGFHLVGGPLPGEEALYERVSAEALALPNVRFHGAQPYAATNALYGRARLFVNTSDVEGFPNSYLQAWIRGVPVVARFDPDGLIDRHGLGRVPDADGAYAPAIRDLLEDASAWRRASAACTAYMEREHGEEAALAPYLETFEQVLRAHPGPARRTRVPGGAMHG